MFEANGFFDYCVNTSCLVNYEATIKRLYDFGYRTVAINQTLDSDYLEKKKKKKKGEPREAVSDPVPEPYNIPPSTYEHLKVLNRLTIVFSNQDVMHKITKSPNYKKYDLIAVLPTTLPATLFVCSSFEADIFCFNPENRNHVKRSRKMYSSLIDRGYHFELPYSPAIHDVTKRKNIIHMGHVYHSCFKSKNIIVSSGATSPALIRSPYDIINLGLIFGLNEQQAKSAITRCGRQVFINSVGRRHGKAVVFAETLETQETKQPRPTKHLKDASVICLSETLDPQETTKSWAEKNLKDSSVICLSESDEDLDTDPPASKKVKQ